MSITVKILNARAPSLSAHPEHIVAAYKCGFDDEFCFLVAENDYENEVFESVERKRISDLALHRNQG